LPLFAHNLWISNRTPAAEQHFLAVVFPYRQGESSPHITRLDDLTVRIESLDISDVISFDSDCTLKPDIVVDYKSIRAGD